MDAVVAQRGANDEEARIFGRVGVGVGVVGELLLSLDAAVERERRFDPDLWLVAVEDRDGRDFLGTSRLDGV
jgi:hypothetical protein